MLYPLPKEKALSLVAIFNIPVVLRGSYQRAGLNSAMAGKNLVSFFLKGIKRNIYQAFKTSGRRPLEKDSARPPFCKSHFKYSVSSDEIMSLSFAISLVGKYLHCHTLAYLSIKGAIWHQDWQFKWEQTTNKWCRKLNFRQWRGSVQGRAWRQKEQFPKGCQESWDLCSLPHTTHQPTSPSSPTPRL